ncbi:hypothetical protein TcasGA2_TC007389 [Tribolium castaneum]|uniref:Uncharacterized protein n=1 Tax=Tribolium castaneum TaxID=7070 RepID=D1ZZV8_TRICA|nr:hypothetical protein TcasGA2_TC007389 [Tribolium castaneum]
MKLRGQSEKLFTMWAETSRQAAGSYNLRTGGYFRRNCTCNTNIWQIAQDKRGPNLQFQLYRPKVTFCPPDRFIFCNFKSNEQAGACMISSKILPNDNERVLWKFKASGRGSGFAKKTRWMVVWMSDGERHLRTSSIGHPFSLRRLYYAWAILHSAFYELRTSLFEIFAASIASGKRREHKTDLIFPLARRSIIRITIYFSNGRENKPLSPGAAETISAGINACRVAGFSSIFPRVIRIRIPAIFIRDRFTRSENFLKAKQRRRGKSVVVSGQAKLPKRGKLGKGIIKYADELQVVVVGFLAHEIRDLHIQNGMIGALSGSASLNRNDGGNPAEAGMHLSFKVQVEKYSQLASRRLMPQYAR